MRQGGAAFPYEFTSHILEGNTGMTLLAWFAGQFLASGHSMPDRDAPYTADDIANQCVLVAKALINRLEKEK